MSRSQPRDKFMSIQRHVRCNWWHRLLRRIARFLFNKHTLQALFWLLKVVVWFIRHFLRGPDE